MKYRTLTLFILVLATTGAYADNQEMSCRKEIGRRKAKVYVQQCIQISPATHPPCHEKNPCSLILDEIKRSCQYAKETPNGSIPKFCNKYLNHSK